MTDRPNSWAQRNLTAVLVTMAVGLAGLLIALGLMASSLSTTRDELDQTRADLERVEQGAAGSALVAAQVLEISRQLTELEPRVSAGLDQAIAELEDFSNSTLTFDVGIDETVIIDTEITIDRDFSFPINEVIALDQTVDTTIEIDTGLGFRVPVDVTVPVQVDVPIDLDVDVPINETVPVVAEVPVMLDVPIEIDLAETELKSLADQLADGLRSVKAVLADLRL